MTDGSVVEFQSRSVVAKGCFSALLASTSRSVETRSPETSLQLYLNQRCPRERSLCATRPTILHACESRRRGPRVDMRHPLNRH